MPKEIAEMMLVPREPTEEMLEAGSAVKAKFSFRETRIDVYKAMLSAAPMASQMGEPMAWIRGHQWCDFPTGATEYDEEVHAGRDKPNGDGWTPLYSAPAAGMDADWIEACAKEIQEWAYGQDGIGCETEETEEFSPSRDRAEIAAIIRKYNG